MELDPIVRGDYEEIEVKILNPPDEDHPEPYPRDIRTDKLVFIAKLAAKDATSVFQKSTDVAGDIDLVDGAGGIAIIKINPEDTMPIPSTKTLRCTMEVTDALGRPATTFHSLPVTWRYI